MKTLTRTLAGLAIALSPLLLTAPSSAGFGTTVPVSAEAATNIAGSLYPRTIALDNGSLFVSQPVVSYPGEGSGPARISVRVNVQVLRRQSDQSLVASAPGLAQVSGEIGYDRKAAQILMTNPRIDDLVFDASEPGAEQLRADLLRQWGERITNPMRIEVPGHPYLLPFKQGIRDISLRDESIIVEVLFE
jgi:hypothetical protein